MSSGTRSRCVDDVCELGSSGYRTNIDPAIVDAEVKQRPMSSLLERQMFDGEAAASNIEAVVSEADAMLAESSPDTPLEVTLWLHENDFDLAALRGTEGEERASIIAARQSQNAESQDQVARVVEKYGGTVLARRWLTNSILVEAPIESIEALVRNPMVYAAYLGGDVSTTARGRRARAVQRLQHGRYQPAAFSRGKTARSQARIRRPRVNAQA